MKFRIIVAAITAALFTSCGLFDEDNSKHIKSVKQFLQIPEDSDSDYVLVADLDFSGVKITPKRFYGSLDGNDHVISNLTIKSSEDCVGLFSQCSGGYDGRAARVSNLTIRNVLIDAPQSDYVGVISGNGGTFTNCKVIFGVSSSVTGDRYVGGIAGYGASMVRCSVESTSSGYVVRGNTCVGGLVGQIPYASYNVVYEIGSCSVKAMVAGSEYVGGLVGDNRADMDITNSCFVGKASGKNYVGGIVGYNYTPASNNTISSCFVDADITASGECAGGILGSGYSSSVKIVSCYTKGSVNAPKYCGGLLGGYRADSELCYSVMESSSGCYYGLGEDVSAKDCATVHSKASAYTVKNTSVGCTDITTHLLESYSEYEHYWNFADIWMYNGTVSCPKLAWESSFDQSLQEDVNPWNGSKATSFSSGTGTLWDPYIITTGGQLLLAKDYFGKYFALGGNIDLNNKNWLPFSFSGTLDGKGYEISNLYIERTDDYQGLFSQCSGTVSNLTVKNVTISAPTCDYVGVISGSGGTFTNCKVIFGVSSSVTGDRYVGGMSGSDAKFTGCYIESTSQNPVVRGNSYVGGLVGSTRSVIESCAVKAIVVGAEDVGGIVGSGFPSIRSSSFQGKVEGESNIGGIIGTYESWHEGSLMHSCKVDADVIARESSAGGLIGYNMNNEHEVISCYTQGSVNAKTRCGGLVGDRYSLRCDLCYSVMESSSDSFDGLGVSYHTDCATAHYPRGSIYGTNVKYNCTDITTFLKECYSEYAEYWNFNNTWTWTGVVDGKTVSVSCPKLSWEKL